MMSYGPGTLVAQTDQYNDTGKLLPVFFIVSRWVTQNYRSGD